MARSVHPGLLAAVALLLLAAQVSAHGSHSVPKPKLQVHQASSPPPPPSMQEHTTILFLNCN
jgi:hypothetical protein